jgi:predicted nucleic acid-binding protein
MVDTTVLLAGTVWPRWPYEVLQHALRGDFYLVLSRTVLQEAVRKFTEKFPAYTQDFEDFLEKCGYAEIPEPSSQAVLAHRDLMRDITDIPIAVAAINAGVDFFVSEDKDFTARDQTTAKLHHFTARDQTTARLHQELTVMLSGTFLHHVMGWTGEELEAVRNRTWMDLEAD